MKKSFGVLCFAFVLSANVLADGAHKIAAGTIVKTLAKTSLSWDGNKLLAYPEGKPEVTILRITIPQGAQLPMHKHTVINAGVLLKGELTVTTKENEILYLKAGDSIVEVVEKWHYGKNEGEIPAEIIVFYAGVQDESVTIKQ